MREARREVVVLDDDDDPAVGSMRLSVDLAAAQRRHLAFLRRVHDAKLTWGELRVGREALRRYQLWLTLVRKHGGGILPPLDVAWLWHCHRLVHPHAYARCVGSAAEDSLIAFDAQDEDAPEERGQTTRLLWEQTHSEPFWWQKKGDPRGEVTSNNLGVDLLATCDREAQFLWQVSRLSPEEEGVEEYRRFLSSREAPHRRIEFARRTHVAATSIAAYRADCLLLGGQEAVASDDRYVPPAAFWREDEEHGLRRRSMSAECCGGAPPSAESSGSEPEEKCRSPVSKLTSSSSSSSLSSSASMGKRRKANVESPRSKDSDKTYSSSDDTRPRYALDRSHPRAFVADTSPGDGESREDTALYVYSREGPRGPGHYHVETEDGTHIVFARKYRKWLCFLAAVSFLLCASGILEALRGDLVPSAVLFSLTFATTCGLIYTYFLQRRTFPCGDIEEAKGRAHQQKKKKAVADTTASSSSPQLSPSPSLGNLADRSPSLQHGDLADRHAAAATANAAGEGRSPTSI